MDADGKNERTLLIIGEEIAIWRKAKGYTQNSFAQAVGISVRNIQDIEQGRRVVKFEEAYMLKAFMGVDDDFFATSDLIKKKYVKASKPLDYDIGSLNRKIHHWHEMTPYCDEKEEDFKTLKGVVEIMMSKWKNRIGIRE